MDIKKLTDMPYEILEIIFFNLKAKDLVNLSKTYNKKINYILDSNNKYFWNVKFNIDYYNYKFNKFGKLPLYVMDNIKSSYFYTNNKFKPNMNEIEYYLLNKILKSKMIYNQLITILATKEVLLNINKITINFIECFYKLYEKSRRFNINTKSKTFNIVDKYKYSYTILDFKKILNTVDQLFEYSSISLDQIKKSNTIFVDLFILYRYQQNCNN